MTSAIVGQEDEQQQLIRKSVADIVARFGPTYFRERALAGEHSTELWSALASAGFMSVNLPEAYGGGGHGITELSIVVEEVAAGGAPLLLMIVSPAICGSVIARYGSDGQKSQWLPLLCGQSDPSYKMAFAITEPDAGSNSHRISTTARRDGADWVISGTKTYISGVDEAGAILVVTRTGTDQRSGRGELSLFIVDAEAPGLSRQVIPTEIVAPERQFTLFFDDVRVGGDRLVGVCGDGLKQVFSGLNPERITGAALLNGIGRYCLDRAADYARERRVWDTPIATHQGIAHPLAEARINLELARLMTTRAANLYDAGLDAGEASNMAKFAAAEAALKCVDQAIQTHGGNGMAREYGIASMWGLARLLRIAPVSREMILNYVAQHSLGLPRSY